MLWLQLIQRHIQTNQSPNVIFHFQLCIVWSMSRGMWLFMVLFASVSPMYLGLSRKRDLNRSGTWLNKGYYYNQWWLCRGSISLDLITREEQANKRQAPKEGLTLLHPTVCPDTGEGNIARFPVSYTSWEEHCSELAQHCNIRDIWIFQREMSERALGRVCTVFSLFKTRQYGILLTSARAGQDIPLSSHPISPPHPPLARHAESLSPPHLQWKLPVVPTCPETGSLWDLRSLITAGLSLWAPLNLHGSARPGVSLRHRLTLGRLECVSVCVCLLVCVCCVLLRLSPSMCVCVCVHFIHCSWQYTVESPADFKVPGVMWNPFNSVYSAVCVCVCVCVCACVRVCNVRNRWPPKVFPANIQQHRYRHNSFHRCWEVSALRWIQAHGSLHSPRNSERQSFESPEGAFHSSEISDGRIPLRFYIFMFQASVSFK